MIDPEAVVQQYRDGTLSAERAAEALLPLLKAAGKLELPLTETDMPLLTAIQRLSRPPLPPAQPLTWDSKVWRGLSRMPDLLWPQIVQHRLDQIPQCFNYVFLVGSEAAAESLQVQIESSTDHAVTAHLPDSFEQMNGRVFGQVPARLVTQDDLTRWAAWLQSLTPIPDATLEKLHLSNPPRADAG